MLSLLSSLQPPPTAEELALKEQVAQTLASQGVLGKLKAELRAAVFLVMHDRDGFVDAAKAERRSTRRLSDFPADTRALAMALMAECLRFFNWEHTLQVLLAEANAEGDEQDAAVAKRKLGLASGSGEDMPTLFRLIEARLLKGEEEEEEEAKHPELEEEEAPTKPGKQEGARKLEEKQEEDAGSVEMEESMAEELPSDLELDESVAAEREQDEQDEQSDGEDAAALASPLPATHEDEEDDDAVALAAPPPAPSKLPTLPPLVGAPNNGLAETEAERLRSLDAALKAMEAEDDTGTLQQLKASLQMELREHDSLASREEEARDAAEASRDDEDGDGYGSSDFEEDEEIHRCISEEMESMPELSDKEDDSQDEAVAAPPRVLQTDTRVDSEDALHSYDYIEAVDKSDW
ncbi:hypothetical protein BBJ28_00009505 [Nothophytophthora sp. Chile5]|nr:hypothetical protein BBJ28_00009505 [Nothophytophthora sp. Chile5]